MVEETIEKIKILYENGLSVKEIAKNVNCSESTVNRKIKELPEQSREVRVQSKSNKQQKKALSLFYATSITQSDLKIQDQEENWIVDIKLLRDRVEEESKFWAFIVYPETKDIEDVIKELTFEMIKASISPLHNKDIWLHDSPLVSDEETGEILLEKGERYKYGDKKKEHYHVLLQFDKPMSFKNVYKLTQRISGNKVAPTKVYSPYSYFEYLWHKNEDIAIKAHYSREDVIIINGFNPELSQSDKDVLLQDIAKHIRKYKLQDLDAILEHYNYSLEVIQAIKGCSYFVQQLCNAQYHKAHPTEDKRVHIVIDNISQLQNLVNSDSLLESPIKKVKEPGGYQLPTSEVLENFGKEKEKPSSGYTDANSAEDLEELLNNSY